MSERPLAPSQAARRPGDAVKVPFANASSEEIASWLRGPKSLTSAAERPGTGLRIVPACASLDLATFELPVGRYLLGSAPECDVVIPAEGVAPRHCTLIVGRQRHILKAWSPLTWLNDGCIQEAAVKSGDRLILGPVELHLEAYAVPVEQPVPAAAAPAPMPIEELAQLFSSTRSRSQENTATRERTFQRREAHIQELLQDLQGILDDVIQRENQLRAAPQLDVVRPQVRSESPAPQLTEREQELAERTTLLATLTRRCKDRQQALDRQFQQLRTLQESTQQQDLALRTHLARQAAQHKQLESWNVELDVRYEGLREQLSQCESQRQLITSQQRQLHEEQKQFTTQCRARERFLEEFERKVSVRAQEVEAEEARLADWNSQLCDQEKHVTARLREIQATRLAISQSANSMQEQELAFAASQAEFQLQRQAFHKQRLEVDQQQQQLKELQLAFEVERNAFQQERQAAEERNAEEQCRQAQRLAELEAREQLLANREEELSAQQHELTKLREELTQKSAADEQAQTQALDARAKELDQREEDLRLRTVALESRHEELAQREASLAREQSAQERHLLQDQAIQFAEQHADIQAQRAVLLQDQHSLKEIQAELTAEREQISEIRATLEAERQEDHAQREALRQQQQELQQRAEELHKREAAYEQQVAALQNEREELAKVRRLFEEQREAWEHTQSSADIPPDSDPSLHSLESEPDSDMESQADEEPAQNIDTAPRDEKKTEDVVRLRSELAALFGIDKLTPRAVEPEETTAEEEAESLAVAEEIEPEVQQPLPEPFTSQAPPGEEEDSIASYMERLLARSRQRSTANSAPPSSPAPAAPAPRPVAPVVAEKVDDSAPKSEPVEPLKTRKRKHQDKESLRANLNSFRELANQSARTAVAKSHANRKSSSMRSAWGFSLCGMTLTALLLATEYWFSTPQRLPAMVCGGLTAILTGFAGWRYLEIRRLRRLEQGLAEPEIEPTPIDPATAPVIPPPVEETPPPRQSPLSFM